VKSLIRFATIFFLACHAHAVLDLNGDQVPDVWALVYNTGTISLTADNLFTSPELRFNPSLQLKR
jgi:hypothetical protein